MDVWAMEGFISYLRTHYFMWEKKIEICISFETGGHVLVDKTKQSNTYLYPLHIVRLLPIHAILSQYFIFILMYIEITRISYLYSNDFNTGHPFPPNKIANMFQ